MSAQVVILGASGFIGKALSRALAGDVDVPVKVVGDAAEALDGADALLILTDWPEFATPPAEALRRMRRRVVIDCVGIVDEKRTDLRDVTYVTMGRAD